MGRGLTNCPAGGLALLHSPKQEAPIAAFPKPPGLKTRDPGRIKQPGKKAPRQFKDRQRLRMKFSSRIRREGFSSARL